jgi:carbamoyl-phosphate synthase small subunit
MSSTLQAYLAREGTVAIANVDTRRLTRLLRTRGAQNGCILTLPVGVAMTSGHVADAVAKARGGPNMAGLDLAKVVSEKAPYEWTETEWTLGSGYGTLAAPKFDVVAYDYGIKRNILRMLASRGARSRWCRRRRRRRGPEVQAGRHLSEQRTRRPRACDYAIEATRELVEGGHPTFGICLGHQIMALAAGAKTFKMKFGHHGANHPVKDLDTGRVSITSQNHGFAVDEKTLPANLRATHVSLFDGTLQGLARTDKPAFCFQGHPEASPGPHDIGYLFDRFTALMQSRRDRGPGPQCLSGPTSKRC